MHIAEVCSIIEAVLALSALTKRTWTTAEFTRAVIRLRLPIYAAAPLGTSIVCKRYVDDRLVVTLEPSMNAQYVTLLQSEIEELAYSHGPKIITDLPAWLLGDKPYRTWDEIATFRKGDHRVLGHWETEQAEWMGQSDEYFFSEPVQVTEQSTLFVPRHTIAELVLNEAVADSQTALMHGAAPLTSPVLAEYGQGAAQGTLAKNPAPSVILLATAAEATSPVTPSPQDKAILTPSAKKTNTWDLHDLRRLLEESLIQGNTHAALAEKYGVSRQFIGKQLATAKGLFNARKPSPFDALGSRSRKK